MLFSILIIPKPLPSVRGVTERSIIMARALYATNVYHYDHVVEALNAVSDGVGLVSRLEFSQQQLDGWPAKLLPGKLLSLLNRRVHVPTVELTQRKSLGPAQVVLPGLSRLGFGRSPRAIRAVNESYASRVSATAANYEVLQFVEGLGHLALKRHEFQTSICERRNFHHEVFETPIESYNGFPAEYRLDPLRDVLDFEYAQADFILVYSEAVRDSFIARGYSADKVKVCPIGLRKPCLRVNMAREDFTMLFVGRGDVFKGLDVAVAAIQLLGRPFKLRVAGPMQPSVLTWLKQQGQVEYLGILTQHELSLEYARSALLLVPSIESFGLAAADAVQQGLRILCSPTTGLSEYIREPAKVTVCGRDPIVWAEAISDAVDEKNVEFDPGLALAELSMEKCSERLLSLYEDILGV